jgi:hypothetical protein
MVRCPVCKKFKTYVTSDGVILCQNLKCLRTTFPGKFKLNSLKGGEKKKNARI